MSIHNIPEIIKQRTGIDHFGFVYILVLIGVGVSAFGLGRLSGAGTSSNIDSKVVVTSPYAVDSQNALPLEANAIDSINSPKNATSKIDATSGNFLASKNGKMYYTKGCKASSRIKEENKIWFDTRKEAESLGYKASASCK